MYDEGASIYMDEENQTLELNNCNIYGSYGRYGTAIYVDEDNAHIILNNTSIHDNFAVYHGGAIYCDADNLNLELNNSSYICDNWALYDGGAIYIDNDDASITLNNSSIFGNKSSVDGGAIFSNGSGLNITLTDHSSLLRNRAEGDGGAICYSNYTDIDAQLVMDSSSQIYGNKAQDDGGALYVGGEGLTISGGTINYNGCYYDGDGLGGGVYFFNDNCSVKGTTFVGNSAYSGGAIYLTETNYSIENCDIHDNEAVLCGGGICIIKGGKDNKIYLSDVSIHNNHAKNYGGGVYLSSNVYLSGIVNITGNTSESDNKADNLYLQYTTDRCRLFTTPEAGSVIGVSTDFSSNYKTVSLTANGDHNAESFLSDNDGWHIEADSSGRLALVKGASAAYTVTYHNGDETNTEIVSGKLPDTLPVPEGDFVGWFYDDSFTTQANAGDSIDHNIDLYAKFSQTTTYTLHYHINAEDLGVYDSTETGTTLPDNLWSPDNYVSASQSAAYDFVGWFYDDGDFKNEARGGDEVSGDTDLYAYWSPITTVETVIIDEEEISEETIDDISEDDGETGSVFGENSIGIIIAGIVVIIGGVLVCIIVVRKRKQSQK